MRLRLGAWREPSRHQLVARSRRLRPLGWQPLVEQGFQKQGHPSSRRRRRPDDGPHRGAGYAQRASACRTWPSNRKRCRSTAACSVPVTCSTKVSARSRAGRARAALAIADKSKVFNTARIEAMELENLIESRVRRWCRPTPAPSAAARTCVTTSRSGTTGSGSAHAVLRRWNSIRLQAGQHEAADGAHIRAQEADVLDTQAGRSYRANA